MKSLIHRKSFSLACGLMLFSLPKWMHATGNVVLPATANALADYSSVYGDQATATKSYGVAIGYNAKTAPVASGGSFTTAVGANSIADNTGATALGGNAHANGNAALAIGYYASATGTKTISIGYDAVATGSYSMAIGRTNTASGQSSVTVGRRNTATALASVALGYYNVASDLQGAAVGFRNTATGYRASAFGHHTVADGVYSMAFGARSIAVDENSMVLGFLSTAAGVGSLSAGCQSETAGEGATAVGFENYSGDKSASTFGRENVAEGLASTALGYKNAAGAAYATAIGSNVTNNTANSVMIGPSDTAKVTILSSGNVGIGTTSPTQKLSVNGTVRAKEVLVETTGWSDYVFASGYRLAPLAEVEQHIKAKGHLPGVPSAEDVQREGISLGAMQAKLLEKIEELTLHQIAQEKELAALKAENAQLRAGMTGLGSAQSQALSN